MKKKQYYPDSQTEITSAFFKTRCSCGFEFFRIHEIQRVTCRKCGREFTTTEPPKGGMNLD